MFKKHIIKQDIARTGGFAAVMTPIIYAVRFIALGETDVFLSAAGGIGAAIPYFFFHSESDTSLPDRLLVPLGVVALGGAIHTAAFTGPLETLTESLPGQTGYAPVAFFSDLLKAVDSPESLLSSPTPLGVYVFVGTVVIGSLLAVAAYRGRGIPSLLVACLIAGIGWAPTVGSSSLIVSTSTVVVGLYLFFWPVFLLIVLHDSVSKRDTEHSLRTLSQYIR